MKLTWKTYLLATSAIIAMGSLVFILVETVEARNTGFETKTLWDWMELLIIPAVLAGGAFALNRSEYAIEREIATDRQQEVALQSYLDRMSDLIHKEKLRTTRNGEVRIVARIRTLTVLRGLDTTRKGLVLRFLYEAGLISKEKTIIDLEGADLRGANLFLARLSDANLIGVDLSGADLKETDLRGTVLEEANLRGANMQGSYLFGANLLGASLRNANLTGSPMSANPYTDEGRTGQHTDLFGADLTGADLTGADMRDALFTTQQLRYVRSYKGAIMPGGGHFPDNYNFDKD